MGLRSHHSKHTKKNRERSKNRVEFNSVRSGLQASASFRARPEVRFVHNGDVHFRKLPCLRRETLVGSKQAL